MERIATVERNTAETQISLTINLDGTGKCDMKNPIGFFNHMFYAEEAVFPIAMVAVNDLVYGIVIYFFFYSHSLPSLSALIILNSILIHFAFRIAAICNSPSKI